MEAPRMFAVFQSELAGVGAAGSPFGIDDHAATVLGNGAAAGKAHCDKLRAQARGIDPGRRRRAAK
jgi:hypothetical protein